MKDWIGLISTDGKITIKQWKCGKPLPEKGDTIAKIVGPFVALTRASALMFVNDWADHWGFK